MNILSILRPESIIIDLWYHHPSRLFQFPRKSEREYPFSPKIWKYLDFSKPEWVWVMSLRIHCILCLREVYFLFSRFENAEKSLETRCPIFSSFLGLCLLPTVIATICYSLCYITSIININNGCMSFTLCNTSDTKFCSSYFSWFFCFYFVTMFRLRIHIYISSVLLIL